MDGQQHTKPRLRIIGLVFVTMFQATSAAAPPAHAASDTDAATHLSQNVLLYGASGAPVTVVSYMDFTCPYCRQMRPALRRLVNESAGQVNWEFRHFPIGDMGSPGWIASTAALCAGDLRPEQAWSFVDQLLAQPHPSHSTMTAIVDNVAVRLQLQPDTLHRCMRSDAPNGVLHKEKTKARRAGVAATPTIVVRSNLTGERTIASGALTLAQLQTLIENIREPRDKN